MSSVAHSIAQTKCLHCQKLFWGESNAAFCCGGCERVYALIQSCGLGSYYTQRDSQALSPADDVQAGEYDYLDALLASSQPVNHVQFYIPDIHCSSCIWVLERLPKMNPHILEASVSLMQNSIRVTYNEGIRPSQVALLIREMGYRVTYSTHESAWEEIKRERKTALSRIAVAGFAAGNSMIYAIAVYAGADPLYQQIFNSLAAILYLPVFFYSSVPLYQSAWRSIQSRQIGVDVPLCLALFFGSIYSYFSILSGSSQLYFDTLSSLVFLILISRFLLREIEIGSKSFLHLNDREHTAIEHAPGSKVTLTHRERLDFDAILTSSSAEFDYSWINGESRPVLHRQGDSIAAGAILLSPSAQFEVVRHYRETEFYRQLEQAKQTRLERPHYLESADRWARVFLAVIVTVAGILMVQGHFDRAMALLVISCPCALSLATPMTYSLALREFFKRGLVLKSTLPLEKIARAKTLFFDKTGTLSEGVLRVVEERNFSSLSLEQVRSLIYSIERSIQHPIAASLRSYIEVEALKNAHPEITLASVKDVQSIAGLGVEATLEDGTQYRIQKTLDASSFTSCELIRVSDSTRMALYRFEDQPRAHAAEVLKRLREKGLSIQIVSGDHTEAVKRFAQKIGLTESDAWGDLSPKQKEEQVMSSPRQSVMVGDGMNDGLALSRASVGVATGNTDPELNADVLIRNDVMPGLEYLVLMSKHTFRVLDQNIAFSALYNSIGLVAACMGWVSPLLAAILMPLSAISVLINAVIQIRFSSQKIARPSCKS